MGERRNLAMVLGCTLLAFVLLDGAVSAARGQDSAGRELKQLMADAQQGVAEAQYRLGQYYEAQHDLARGDPDTAADHTNLLLAFAWFQSAEEAGYRDARSARVATDLALQDILGERQYKLAMESVAGWMKDQRSPPPPERPSQPAIAGMENTATEPPPEALTELAAGDEKNEPEVVPVQAPEAEAEAVPVQAPEAVAVLVPPSPASPEIKNLLARGTSYLETGDVISARGFFKMAAGQGSGEGAMLVGVTYDPGYLEMMKVVGLRPDAEQATAWYLKAIDMGHDEAESRFLALKRRLDQR